MNLAQDQLQSFLNTLPGTVEGPPFYTHQQKADNAPSRSKTHFAMDFSVNYAGISVPTVPYLHADFAP